MRRDKGVALVLSVMAVALLAALGLSLSVLTSIEMRIAGNYADSIEARSAAESALELAIRELLGINDWDGVVAGTVSSTITDGLVQAPRLLGDGSQLDLMDATARLGAPEWRLFAHAPLSDVGIPSKAYVVVWVRPDPRVAGALRVRADAFGPSSGTRKGVQATVSPSSVLLWTEVR